MCTIQRKPRICYILVEEPAYKEGFTIHNGGFFLLSVLFLLILKDSLRFNICLKRHLWSFRYEMYIVSECECLFESEGRVSTGARANQVSYTNLKLRYHSFSLSVLTWHALTSDFAISLVFTKCSAQTCAMNRNRSKSFIIG